MLCCTVTEQRRSMYEQYREQQKHRKEGKIMLERRKKQSEKRIKFREKGKAMSLTIVDNNFLAFSFMLSRSGIESMFEDVWTEILLAGKAVK